MNLHLAIRGSLANLPDGGFDETDFLLELQSHGLAAEDGRMALEKALLEAFVRRADSGQLVRLKRAQFETGAGREAM